MSEPVVSVVIPTHNRPHRLAMTINALRAQTLRPDKFEVIVVDDGSRPETDAVLRAESARGELHMRTLRNPGPRGPAAARNAGWAVARAPLVAFTDDDCVPDPQWLSAGLAAHAATPRAIVQGRTKPDPAERSKLSPLSHTVIREQLGPSYETCNIFYPRTVLESTGGFDERFGPTSAGEDTDLAWRALSDGVDASFAPDALVFHGVERLSARQKLGMAGRWSSCVRVLAEHPEARSMLEHGVFWNVWHLLLWRSLFALALPRPLRRLVIARHMRALRARSVDLGGGPSAIPFLLALDAAECWAILRGAVRYRTLVL